MIQATSGTSEISPDATSPPPKKDEPVQMPNLPKPVPSRQVTPALEQVDAVAAEAVWVKREAHECEREFRRRAEATPPRPGDVVPVAPPPPVPPTAVAA